MPPRTRRPKPRLPPRPTPRQAIRSKPRRRRPIPPRPLRLAGRAIQKTRRQPIRQAWRPARPRLADDRWVQVVAAPGETAPAKFRWRHFGLEAWLARGTWQPELAAALADSQRIVATNAAIVLARRVVADSRVVPALVAAIDDVNVRLPLRFAAVEALSFIATIEARGELERLADQQAQFLARDAVGLHTRNARSGAFGIDRDASAGRNEPGEFQICGGVDQPGHRSPPRVAVGVVRPGRKDFPPSALELRRDPDPRVRAAALEAMAMQRPQPAETLLLAALDDTDLSVRIAAIVALGKFGTPAARSALEKLRSHSHEAARVASVQALCKLAGYQAVVPSAHDKSWRVRQAVAESLSQAGEEGDRLSVETVELARSLVHDPSLDVQRQMLQSLGGLAADNGRLRVVVGDGRIGISNAQGCRGAVDRALAGGGGISGRSSSGGTSRGGRRPHGALEQRISGIGRTGGAAKTSKAMRRRILRPRIWPDCGACSMHCGDTEIRAAMRQAALDSLVAYGAALPAALESPALADRGPLPEVVYEEVLPKVSPVFAALDGLSSGDVRLRRGGGTQLSQAMAGKPMTPLASIGWSCWLAARPILSCWQCLLAATAGDARAGAVQLAYLAVGNSSSDVRRRACDYLAAHADVRHAAVLLPMLEDPSSTVVIAAVRGLGADRHDGGSAAAHRSAADSRPRAAARGGHEPGAIESRGWPCGDAADGARRRPAVAAGSCRADGRAGRTGFRADAHPDVGRTERRRPRGT